MVEIEERLAESFASVFPELGGEIRRASQASVPAWDSLAAITLISVIEEEFEISIPPEEFEFLISFDLIVDYLKRHTVNA